MSARARRTELRLGNAFAALFQRCAEEAIARGATDPRIYFEGGSGLIVSDGAVHDADGGLREGAILFTLPWPSAFRGKVSAGAW